MPTETWFTLQIVFFQNPLDVHVAAMKHIIMATESATYSTVF